MRMFDKLSGFEYSEKKDKIHELVDLAVDEAGLEAALAEANRLLTDPQAADNDLLTPAQQARLEASLEQHRQGKIITHEEMKRRHTKWLNK